MHHALKFTYRSPTGTIVAYGGGNVGADEFDHRSEIKVQFGEKKHRFPLHQLTNSFIELGFLVLINERCGRVAVLSLKQTGKELRSHLDTDEFLVKSLDGSSFLIPVAELRHWIEVISGVSS